ncbi:MAG: UDP-N-acetylglucosamine 2-epimerase (non-hydrolyzing), partial [Elusimicrobiota bacterium]|nr:UDP-N-acetylglucosamine 2-epimerase (non-hydrolyzing) [Elusimicrobiota bacterium]
MKIVSVVGARPQFIKIAPISEEIRKKHTEIIVHTGQHYHYKMSGIFFRELNIPTPDYNLKIGSGTHAQQTGKMLVGIEKILLDEQPDIVLVYGDTNSTIAGALASAKIRTPIAHIEAGLRSFNNNMPEEINRILTDRISQLLFCPSDAAVQNLKNEGIEKNVYLVGDVMLDLVRENIVRIQKESKILETLNLQEKQYILATVHRSHNADNIKNLKSIFTAFIASGEKIIMPLHPRTEKMLLHTN